MLLLVLFQCNAWRNYSCCEVWNWTPLQQTFAKHWEIRKKPVELDTFRAVAGRQPHWQEYRNKTQLPFIWKCMRLSCCPPPPHNYFTDRLTDSKISYLEASIVKILVVCWCESVRSRRIESQECRRDSKLRVAKIHTNPFSRPKM